MNLSYIVKVIFLLIFILKYNFKIDKNAVSIIECCRGIRSDWNNQNPRPPRIDCNNNACKCQKQRISVRALQYQRNSRWFYQDAAAGASC